MIYFMIVLHVTAKIFDDLKSSGWSAYVSHREYNKKKFINKI